MSFTVIRPYFRTHLQALGYKEWKDAFNVDNIPSNIFDRAFHTQIGAATQTTLTQDHLQLSVPVTLRVFKKLYRDTSENFDLFADDTDAIIQRLLKHTNRLAQPLMKNVQVVNCSFAPISGSNDNIMVLTLDMSCMIILSLD